MQMSLGLPSVLRFHLRRQLFRVRVVLIRLKAPFLPGSGLHLIHQFLWSMGRKGMHAVSASLAFLTSATHVGLGGIFAKCAETCKGLGTLVIHVGVEVSANFIAKVLLYSRASLRFATFPAEIYGWNAAISKGQRLSTDDEDVVICARKKLFFIRHGESVWNAILNKERRGFLIPRLIACTIWELLLLFERDSIILDSPLSPSGVAQSLELRDFLAGGCWETLHQAAPASSGGVTGDDVHSKSANFLAKRLPAEQDSKGGYEMCGSAGGEVSRENAEDPETLYRGPVMSDGLTVISSNLRRSISTALIAFRPWLSRTASQDSKRTRKIVVVPSMQESTCNFDGMSLAGRNRASEVSQLEKLCGESTMTQMYTMNLDTTLCVEESWFRCADPLAEKMTNFATWVFDDCKTDNVAAVGHSIWIQRFFNFFLPVGCEHAGQKKKVVNCGALCLEFLDMRKGSVREFRIDPKSITMVYGGFKP